MITLISLASLHVPNYEKINFKKNDFKASTPQVVQLASNVQAPLSSMQAYALNFKGNSGTVENTQYFSQEFRLPQSMGVKSFDKEVIEKYSPTMKKVVEDFNQRKGQKGQFLNWVDLPKNQLEKDANGLSSVDKVYSQAIELRNRKTNGVERPLVVLGIGGSKHTAEFLLNMNGGSNQPKVYFYSDIDPISYSTFLKDVGGDVRKLNFVVVSKSGTTFETNDGFMRFKKALIESYKKPGVSEQEAEKKAQSHFAIVTDATATDKNLRGKVGTKNGKDNNYIKELYVHDDVGGRFSMFDDSGIFTLAYAGIPKSVTERILKGADEAGKKLMNAENLKENTAAKSAMFNIYSRENGFGLTQQQLFGRIFENGGENWYKQLYLESLKDFKFMVGKAPDSMHYATEGHFDPANRSNYNTVMTIINPKSENYSKYTSAIAQTYNETTPLTIEKLEVEGNRIKPEAIGQYIQSKHFETIYMGMLKRAVEGRTVKPTDALPEVLQPSVETYKNKFKPGSSFELTPGGK